MLKVVDYEGYGIREDGIILSLKGKQMFVEETNGIKSIRLMVKGERKAYNISRLLYYCFVNKFDIYNRELCISFKDGNKENISIDNLFLVNRCDLRKDISFLKDSQSHMVQI